MHANRFLLSEKQVLTALGVIAIRRKVTRPVLEGADLLALTYVWGHLVRPPMAPVAWVLETANSTRFRYKVAGARGVGLARFLLDYSSTRFGPSQRTPDKLAAHFDWYLSVCETALLDGAGIDQSGVALDEALNSRMITEASRAKAIPGHLLGPMRVEWEEANRANFSWLSYRVP